MCTPDIPSLQNQPAETVSCTAFGVQTQGGGENGHLGTRMGACQINQNYFVFVIYLYIYIHTIWTSKVKEQLSHFIYTMRQWPIQTTYIYIYICVYT